MRCHIDKPMNESQENRTKRGLGIGDASAATVHGAARLTHDQMSMNRHLDLKGDLRVGQVYATRTERNQAR